MTSLPQSPITLMNWVCLAQQANPPQRPSIEWPSNKIRVLPEQSLPQYNNNSILISLTFLRLPTLLILWLFGKKMRTWTEIVKCHSIQSSVSCNNMTSDWWHLQSQVRNINIIEWSFPEGTQCPTPKDISAWVNCSLSAGSSGLGILSWSFPLALGEALGHRLGLASSSVKCRQLLIRSGYLMDLQSRANGPRSFVKYICYTN